MSRLALAILEATPTIVFDDYPRECLGDFDSASPRPCGWLAVAPQEATTIEEAGLVPVCSHPGMHHSTAVPEIPKQSGRPSWCPLRRIEITVSTGEEGEAGEGGPGR